MECGKRFFNAEKLNSFISLYQIDAIFHTIIKSQNTYNTNLPLSLIFSTSFSRVFPEKTNCFFPQTCFIEFKVF